MLGIGLALLGAALPFAAGLRYAYGTLRGRVRPNRVTWFVSGVTAWIAGIGQLSQGVLAPAVLTLAVAVVPTLIVLASVANREAYWRATVLDRGCLALAGAAVIVLLLSVGDLAIAMGITARGLGAVPTVVKSFRAPGTEQATAYTLGFAGAACTLLSLEQWTFRTAGFAGYFLVFCGVMSWLVWVRPNAASWASRTPAVWAWIRWNPASRAQRCSGCPAAARCRSGPRSTRARSEGSARRPRRATPPARPPARNVGTSVSSG
jgi:hypothetical protein